MMSEIVDSVDESFPIGKRMSPLVASAMALVALLMSAFSLVGQFDHPDFLAHMPGQAPLDRPERAPEHEPLPNLHGALFTLQSTISRNVQRAMVDEHIVYPISSSIVYSILNRHSTPVSKPQHAPAMLRGP